MHKFIQALILALSFGLLSACGGGGSAAPEPPVITSQPASILAYEQQTATFTVTATDSGPMTYQWKKNGVNIAGATSTSLAISNLTLADSGSIYSVAVTGGVGTTTSANAVLTVEARALRVVTQPTPQSVVAGQTASFSVTAAGMQPYTFQWYKNGSAITGATASSYSTPVTLGDNNSRYDVVITNGDGSIRTNVATVTVQNSTLTNLVISEVSTCYYYLTDCWFEVYNPTGSTINLGAYTVKSSSIDVTNGSPSISTFVLPSVSIPSDAYVIISGNSSNLVQRGTQNVRLRTGNMVPYWQSSGFIELINAGATVDFVRFGSSAQAPTTAAKWSGSSVATLAYGPTEYGKSIVRPYPRTSNTNTYSAVDWAAVEWATPAGRNDVPASTPDADGDGIPDSAEVAGGTYAGLDLYAMGARTGQKDIFIEVDHMNTSDPGVIPRKESLQKVVDSFAAKGIHVIFDAGTDFAANFSTANFNLGQGNSVVPYEPCTKFDQTTCSSNSSSRRSIYDWKDEYMEVRRRSVFHYLLFANSQLVDGTSGSSGLAEINGNDFMVTMGAWGFTTTAGSSLNRLINMQASTVMHELGHNLGLQHGGFEGTNYKPNYWSVMNYLYQLNGLDPDASSSTAYQRWRTQKGDSTPSTCSLVASPCGSPAQFVMSYSDGTSTSLNEASLFESANVGRGSNGGAYADWNLNGSLTTSALARDLNGDGTNTVLSDYNDWGNLYFPFVRQYSANSGAFRTTNPQAKPANSSNSLLDDRQPVAEETHPTPEAIFKLLHDAGRAK